MFRQTRRWNMQSRTEKQNKTKQKKYLDNDFVKAETHLGQTGGKQHTFKHLPHLLKKDIHMGSL